jgi:hypothetical protein
VLGEESLHYDHVAVAHAPKLEGALLELDPVPAPHMHVGRGT